MFFLLAEIDCELVYFAYRLPVSYRDISRSRASSHSLSISTCSSSTHASLIMLRSRAFLISTGVAKPQPTSIFCALVEKDRANQRHRRSRDNRQAQLLRH